jgi:hypothetical protein
MLDRKNIAQKNLGLVSDAYHRARNELGTRLVGDQTGLVFSIGLSFTFCGHDAASSHPILRHLVYSTCFNGVPRTKHV